MEMSDLMKRIVAARELFFRLGFLKEETRAQLSMRPEDGEQASLFVVLRAQGKEFFVRVGKLSTEQIAGFAEEFRAVTDATNDGRVPEGDLDEIFHNSLFFQDSESWVTALRADGFFIPVLREASN